MKIALLLHLLAAVVWVGGMFFAYFALRPAAVGTLEPPQRLPLWCETLRRFFAWVWLSIVVLFASGTHLLSAAFGFRSAPAHVVAMLALATVMTLIFAFVFFRPFAGLKRAVAARDWKSGAAALNTIRRLVATNLGLGLATIALAVLGSRTG